MNLGRDQCSAKRWRRIQPRTVKWRALGLAFLCIVSTWAMCPASAVEAQAGPDPEALGITIAKKFSISVSAGLQKRLQDPLASLPDKLADALRGSENVAADVREAQGKYEPPADDDFSFANSDEEAKAIAERVRAAYPNQTKPLLLLTVAERGPYLIAAAYVLPEEKSGGVLTRLSRSVVAAAKVDDKTVKDVWPLCFATSVHQYIKGEAQDDDVCQVSALRQVSASKESRLQTPSTPPQTTFGKTEALKPSVGLLDDVSEKATGVLILPSAPARSLPHQSTPAPLKPQEYVPSNQVAVARPTVESRTVPRSPLAQLLEEVLSHGLMWLPKDPNRISIAFRQLLEGKDTIARCLQDLRQQWGEDELLQDVLSELHQVPRPDSEVFDDNYFRLFSAPRQPKDSLVRRCIPNEPLMIDVRAYPSGTKSSGVTKDAAGLQRNVLESQERLGWRIPQAIEAFAIGTILFAQQQDISFWAKLNNEFGVFTVSYKGKQQLVDFELQPRVSTADLIVVSSNRR
jgi:hypothetical protein